MRGNILVIDDNPNIYDDLKEGLVGHNVFYASELVAIKDKVDRKDIDLAVIDLNFNPKQKEKTSGVSFVKTLRQRYPHLVIVVLSSYRDIDRISQTIKNGADKYIYKGKFSPFSTSFKEDIRQLINKKKKQDEKRAQQWKLTRGMAPLPKKLLQELQSQVGETQSVLLVAEEGLGGEQVALALRHQRHRGSALKMPLFANLTHWEEKELRSLMRKDSTTSKINFFRMANRDVLYLTGIESLSIEGQDIFLEIMEQEKHLHTNEALKIQFVFAVSVEPAELLENHQLSPRLLHRLIRIDLPPLRDRIDELPELISYWKKLNECEGVVFHAEVVKVLQNYHYPANISGLFRILDKAYQHHKQKHRVNAPERVLRLESLPEYLFEHENELERMRFEVANIELKYIEKALKRFRGTGRYKTRAAEAVGVSSADNLKKTYINKYNRLYPELIRRFPTIVEVYKLK